MGVIDQPFTGERWFADGERSHYRGPGGDKVLKTSACETISSAILFTTSPHLFQNEDDRRYREIERKAKLFRYGCDCYAYALLASGHVDQRAFHGRHWDAIGHLHFTRVPRLDAVSDNLV